MTDESAALAALRELQHDLPHIATAINAKPQAARELADIIATALANGAAEGGAK